MVELRKEEREDAQATKSDLPQRGNGAGDRAGEPPEQEPETGQGSTPFTVAMVVKGAKDSRGKPIDDVFFKRQSYAIYQSDKEMAIQFSDDADTASAQIKSVSPLLPMRNRLQFICASFSRFDCYRHQIAEALHLGLEGQAVEGRRLLKVVMEDCKELRASFGRRCYLRSAIPAALIAFALALAVAAGFYAVHLGWSEQMSQSPSLMLLATTGGSIGALLSIAIAIRTRALELDGDPTANRLDAIVRILIGVISAGALYLILASGLFAGIEVKMGDVSLTGADMNWQVALLIGIAAGFVERMVPNLLEGSQPGDPDAPAGNEAAPAGS